MKKVTPTILSFLFLFTTSILLSSCGGNKTPEQPTEEVEQPAEASTEEAIAYACPMHPEETGKEGDVCSKCGMKLEPVTENTTEADSTAH